MKTNKTFIFALILLVILISQVTHAQPAKTWVQYYNGVNSMSDKATAVAIDNNCNVYVTGQSDKLGAGINYMTIKYDDEGNTVWAVEYDGPAHLDDIPNAIKVDANGNVYVTGKSASASNGFDFLTVKYNSSGTQQWASRLNSTSNDDDVANDLSIDINGNVYVCGNQGAGSALIKYNASGTQTWLKTFENLGDWYTKFKKVIIANSGSIEVLGEYGNVSVIAPVVESEVYHFNASNGTYTSTYWSTVLTGVNNPIPVDFVINSSGVAFVCAYNQDGAKKNIYMFSSASNVSIFSSYVATGTANSFPSKIKLDNTGNVYVEGYTDVNTTSTEDLNFLMLKYNSSGAQQWAKTYGGSNEDHAIDFDFGSGSSPDVYVTGYTTNTAGNKDITTLKYNNNGVLQSAWSQTNNGPTNEDDLPVGIKTDAYNNVLLAGYSGGLNAEDYTTIKYINNSFSPVITWTALNTFSATSGTGYQWYYNNAPINGANQQTLNMTSTGNGDYYCMVSQYCYTYKSNVATNCVVGFEPNPETITFSLYPNPNWGMFNLTYALNSNSEGTIQVFNSLGACIFDKVLPIGSTEQKIEIPNISPGIYNCVICSENTRIVKKLVIK